MIVLIYISPDTDTHFQTVKIQYKALALWIFISQIFSFIFINVVRPWILLLTILRSVYRTSLELLNAELFQKPTPQPHKRQEHFEDWKTRGQKLELRINQRYNQQSACRLIKSAFVERTRVFPLPKTED